MPYFLANAYLSLKQPDNAITWLDRTVECLNAAAQGQPEAISIRLRLTILYLKLKRPDQAEKVVTWLNQVLAANGSWIDGYALREAAYEILGNTAAARADSDRIVQGKPQERYNAARLFYDLDQPDKTIALLSPMIAANLPPKDAAMLLMLRAAAYEMKSDYVKSKADYERRESDRLTVPRRTGEIEGRQRETGETAEAVGCVKRTFVERVCTTHLADHWTTIAQRTTRPRNAPATLYTRGALRKAG